LEKAIAEHQLEFTSATRTARKCNRKRVGARDSGGRNAFFAQTANLRIKRREATIAETFWFGIWESRFGVVWSLRAVMIAVIFVLEIESNLNGL
jgi:hypothetical protein